MTQHKIRCIVQLTALFTFTILLLALASPGIQPGAASMMINTQELGERAPVTSNAVIVFVQEGTDTSLPATTPAPEQVIGVETPTTTPVITPPIADQYIYLMITLSALAVLVVFFGLLITRSYRH